MTCSVKGGLKKERQIKSKIKSMFIIFFNIKEIVHKNSSWRAKRSIPNITDHGMLQMPLFGVTYKSHPSKKKFVASAPSTTLGSAHIPTS
jgi:hypothetical protein